MEASGVAFQRRTFLMINVEKEKGVDEARLKMIILIGQEDPFRKVGGHSQSY